MSDAGAQHLLRTGGRLSGLYDAAGLRFGMSYSLLPVRRVLCDEPWLIKNIRTRTDK